MGRLGSNISYGGGIPLDKLRSLGISLVRVVAKQEVDDTAYFKQLNDAGIRIWLTMASESFAGFDSWNAAFDEYKRRYASYVDWWEAGNEPDIVSDSSWMLAQGTYATLLLTARDRLGSNANIAAGGLASGLPGWLEGDDPEWLGRFRSGELPSTFALEHLDFGEMGKPVNLDWVNGVAIHPYGQGPGEPFAQNPGGPFGRVDHKVREYRQWLDTHRPDKSLHVSEWGAPVSEFEPGTGGTLGGDEVPRDVSEYVQRARARPSPSQAIPGLLDEEELAGSPAARAVYGEYIGNMVRTLARLSDLGDAIHFCFTTRMHREFGLTDRDFTPLPGGDGFALALQQTPINA